MFVDLSTSILLVWNRESAAAVQTQRLCIREACNVTVHSSTSSGMLFVCCLLCVLSGGLVHISLKRALSDKLFLPRLARLQPVLSAFNPP